MECPGLKLGSRIGYRDWHSSSTYEALTDICLSFISIQPEGRFWQEPEPSQATGMALAHCILGSFLGVGCHCFPPPLDFRTFASRCLHVQATWETSISERRNYGREMACQFCLWFRLPRKPRVLWHAAQICDMGDGFTSPSKEGMLWIFSPEKSDGFGRDRTRDLGYQRPACTESKNNNLVIHNLTM